MASLADLYVRVRPDLTRLGPELKTEGEKAAGDAGKGAGKKFGGAMVAGIGGVLAAGALVGFFKGAFDEARESVKITRLTEAVIRSTGGAAKVTADDVDRLATRLSNMAGVDDELIASSENVLLTFTNVRNEAGKGNDVFNQGTLAALNMSAALGTDLQGATLQVGKALNDPIKGITALRRAGVSFTEAQIAQITTMQQSGDLMGAQKIILAELSKEFNGAAAAAASPADKARVAWGNFQEMVGLKLLPVLAKVLDFGVKNQGWLVPLAGAVAAFGVVIGVTSVAIKAYNVVTEAMNLLHVGAVAKWIAHTAAIVAHVAVLAVVKTATAVWTAAQWLLNIALDANPIGLIVLAIGILIAIIVVIATKTTWFQTAWKASWDAIKTAALWVWDNFLYPMFQSFQLAIKLLVEASVGMWHGVVAAWQAMTDWISDRWGRLKANVFGPIADFITKTIPQAFRDGVDAIKAAWNKVMDVAKMPIRFIIETVLEDGLLGAYRWIASKFGIDSNVHVKLPPGFSEGGYTGPGPKLKPAGIVHAGEFVMDAANTRKHLPLLTAMWKGKMPGYDGGGLVGWLKGAWDTVTDPVRWLKDKAVGLLDHIPGGPLIRDTTIGVGRSVINGVIQWVKDHITSIFGSGGPAGAAPGFPPWPSSPGASPGDSGVWRSIVNLVNASGIPHSFGNAYRPGDPLWHGSGRAVDWMGYNQDRLAQFFMGRMGQVLELIHRTGSRDYAVTRGRNVGSFSQGLMEEHRNHLHIAMDRGYGVLAPGRNIVDNGTGRREPIAAVTGLAEQMERLIAAVERVAPGVGREINGVGARVVQTARAM